MFQPFRAISRGLLVKISDCLIHIISISNICIQIPLLLEVQKHLYVQISIRLHNFQISWLLLMLHFQCNFPAEHVIGSLSANITWSNQAFFFNMCLERVSELLINFIHPPTPCCTVLCSCDMVGAGDGTVRCMVLNI